MRIVDFIKESISCSFESFLSVSLSRIINMNNIGLLLCSSFLRTVKSNDVIETMKYTDAFASMEFSKEERYIIVSVGLWDSVLIENRSNVDSCLADTKSQLAARRLKLTKLDNELISSFAKGNLYLFEICSEKTDTIYCCLFKMCYEFISICRNLDCKKDRDYEDCQHVIFK